MKPRGLALGAVVVAVLAAGCGDDGPSTGTARLPIGRTDLPPPDQVVENGEHIITHQGVKKAIMRAEQLYFYNQTGKVIGDTIEVTFFDETGGFVSLLTARGGELDQQTREMTATGNVVVRGTGATIRSEELTYDPARDLIHTDQPTEINQEGNVIRGRGVESDPALREIRIRGGSAVLRSEPEIGARPAPGDTTRIVEEREPERGGQRVVPPADTGDEEERPPDEAPDTGGDEGEADGGDAGG